MKMKIITLLLLGGTISANAQQQELPKRANRFPVGTYHAKNLYIHGISVGLVSPGLNDELRNVNTNGIKIEAIGWGVLVPLIPRSPIASSEKEFQGIMLDPVSERINGLGLSATGTVCDCLTNGINLGTLSQINRQVNGVSVSLMINLAQKHNGLQLSAFNESYAMNGFQLGLTNSGSRARGLQIGFFNHSDNLRGFQIGLWNTNQKRKLPIINWSFKG